MTGCWRSWAAQPAGIGFGMGMERLLMALEIYGEKKMEEPALLDVYVAPLGEGARATAFALTQALRDAGWPPIWTIWDAQ